MVVNFLFFSHLLFLGLDLKIAQSQKHTVSMNTKSSKTFWPQDKEGGPCGMENVEGNSLFLIILFVLLPFT